MDAFNASIFVLHLMNDKDKMDYKRVSVQTERSLVTHNNENHDSFSVLLIDVPTEQLNFF